MLINTLLTQSHKLYLLFRGKIQYKLRPIDSKLMVEMSMGKYHDGTSAFIWQTKYLANCSKIAVGTTLIWRACRCSC